jgi:hypothetical protein
MQPIFPKFIKIRWIRGDLNLKFTYFTVHRFDFLKNKKLEKICKNLDKILRSLVKKFF